MFGFGARRKAKRQARALRVLDSAIQANKEALQKLRSGAFRYVGVDRKGNPKLKRKK